MIKFTIFGLHIRSRFLSESFHSIASIPLAVMLVIYAVSIPCYSAIQIPRWTPKAKFGNRENGPGGRLSVASTSAQLACQQRLMDKIGRVKFVCSQRP